MTERRVLSASDGKGAKRDSKSITSDVKLYVLRHFEVIEKLS